MSSPRFSVVLPAHNAGTTIAAAVASALAQSFTEFELIVVDDGSTDDTPFVLAAFDDSRMRVVTQPSSGTPAGARNQGIADAQGGFVAFLDADDSWDSDKLAVVASAIDEDPSVDIVCHAMRLVRDGAHVGVRSYELLPAQPLVDQFLYRGNFLTTSATVVRRARLNAVGGFIADTERPIAEDLDLWIRLAEGGASARLLPDVLGTYTVGRGISRDPARSLSDVLAVLDARYEARALDGSLDVRRALLRRTRATLGAVRDLVRGGHPSAAAGLALRLAPDLFSRFAHYRALRRVPRV